MITVHYYYYYYSHCRILWSFLQGNFFFFFFFSLFFFFLSYFFSLLLLSHPPPPPFNHQNICPKSPCSHLAFQRGSSKTWNPHPHRTRLYCVCGVTSVTGTTWEITTCQCDKVLYSALFMNRDSLSALTPGPCAFPRQYVQPLEFVTRCEGGTSVDRMSNKLRSCRTRHCVNCLCLSLIHIWRCRRDPQCRSRWSPYH